MTVPKENVLTLEAAIARLMGEQEKLNRKLAKRFPPDPPNPKCHYAIIEGLLLSNSIGLLKPDCSNLATAGELRKVFRFGAEELFRWTQDSNEYSLFLSKIDVHVRTEKIWRTAATALRLAVALASAFEHMPETRYSWIYEFNRHRPASEQHLYDSEFPQGGQIHPLQFWAQNADILELLERDEKFYVAAQNLHSAFVNHWFCLVCASAPSGRKRHDHAEPDIWELADSVPGMEIALVQSTKAVEGLLEKPGNRETGTKLERVKSRWRGSTDLDPEEQFSLAGQSFLDYYYALFGLRGAAAHSFGKVSLKMSRIATVQAQCFAWAVLVGYFRKHRIANKDAWQKMHFTRLTTQKVEVESIMKLTRAVAP